jgi:hypothetical protein
LVVLFGVAFLTISRTASRSAATTEGVTVPVPPERTRTSSGLELSTVGPKSANVLLEAMKDELFQLEIERQQGQISVEEYEAQKAALDQTLKRALARSVRNS